MRNQKVLPEPLPLDFYPDSDGKPVGETPRHIDNMRYLLEPLGVWFAGNPRVFVAANMFVYYEKGNRLKHVSPDLFVVLSVPKNKKPERRSYRTWEEGGKAPDLVIELTSESTREEDQEQKMTLYRDVLAVREYFLFDPWGEYLDPRLQGYRLAEDAYETIPAVEGRLPSEVLGLHLEVEGNLLRLYDAKTRKVLAIPPEERQALAQAERERQRAERARRRAERARQQAEQAQERAEAEAERLRRELEELRRRLPPSP